MERAFVAGLLIAAHAVMLQGTVSAQESAGVTHRGGGKCEGMQVEVSFKYNMQSSSIATFKAIQTCIEGATGKVEYAPKAIIKVGKDGSFHHKDEYGNFVKGTISPGGQATGELSKGLSIQCEGGKFFPLCTNWCASPVK